MKNVKPKHLLVFALTMMMVLSLINPSFVLASDISETTNISATNETTQEATSETKTDATNDATVENSVSSETEEDATEDATSETSTKDTVDEEKATSFDGNVTEEEQDTSEVEELAYAILYKNGDMVFQRGDEKDAAKGEVLKSWTGFEDEANFGDGEDGTVSVPWKNNVAQIKTISFKDEIHPLSTAYWFKGCLHITELDLSNLDTSDIENMSFMFYDCLSMEKLDISNLNTSNVKNMSHMFQGTNKLITLDVSNLDTSKVKNMEYMFAGSRAEKLDVSNFNTSNVTNMAGMFIECGHVTELDLSNFNTSKVTDMDKMFYECFNLTTLDISKLDTSKVTNMCGMFGWCQTITELDLSNFDTSNVSNMNCMFVQCENLTNLNISSFKTDKVTDMGNMFYCCESITELDLSSFEIADGVWTAGLLKKCKSLQELKTPASVPKKAIKLPINMMEKDAEDGVVYHKLPDGSKTLIPVGVYIMAWDTIDGVALEGATLELTYENSETGNKETVESWVTTGDKKIVPLEEGVVYTLTETIAPEGYVIKENSIQICMNSDGTINTDQSTMTSMINNTFVIKNEKIPEDQSNNNNTSTKPNGNNASASTLHAAKTGDNAQPYLYLITLLGSIVTIAIFSKKKKVNKN